jgi:hypothetical protein
MSSALLLAGMTIDRAICVTYPMQANQLCTSSRARKIAIAIVLSQAVIGINVFFTFSLSTPGILLRVMPEIQWVANLFDMYELVFGAVLPLTLITGGNMAIIVAVRRAAHDRKSMTSDMTSRNCEVHEGRNITKMLILVSVAFLICTVPLRVYELLLSMPGVLTKYDSASKYWQNRKILEKWVYTEFFKSNFAVNFYLYFLGGGRKFRREVLDLFRSCFKFSSTGR